MTFNNEVVVDNDGREVNYTGNGFTKTNSVFVMHGKGIIVYPSGEFTEGYFNHNEYTPVPFESESIEFQNKSIVYNGKPAQYTGMGFIDTQTHKFMHGPGTISSPSLYITIKKGFFYKNKIFGHVRRTNKFGCTDEGEILDPRQFPKETKHGPWLWTDAKNENWTLIEWNNGNFVRETKLNPNSSEHHKWIIEKFRADMNELENKCKQFDFTL
jgi:hypothetical protein